MLHVRGGFFKTNFFRRYWLPVIFQYYVIDIFLEAYDPAIGRDN